MSDWTESDRLKVIGEIAAKLHSPSVTPNERINMASAIVMLSCQDSHFLNTNRDGIEKYGSVDLESVLSEG